MFGTLSKKEKNIFLIVLTMAIVAVAFFAKDTDQYDDVSWNFDWMYRDIDTRTESLTLLPATSHASHGDCISISKYLPETVSAGEYLVFFTENQSVAVYIGGGIAYVYNEGAAYPQAAYGNWNFIPLSKSDAGEIIVIELTYLYNRFPNNVCPVYLGSVDACLRSIWYDNCADVLLSILLLILGIIIIAFGYCYYKSFEDSYFMRYLGWYLLIFALWGLLQTKLLFIFSQNKALLLYAQLILPMILPIPIVLVCRSLIGFGGMKKEYDDFVILFISYFLLSLLFHLTGISNLIDTYIWSFLFLVVFFVYILMFGLAELQANVGIPSYKIKLFSRLQQSTLLTISLSGIFFVRVAYKMRLGSNVATVLMVMIIIFCCFLLYLILKEIQTLRELQYKLSQSRMLLMVSQIKPHFLYNTLNSIRTLIRTNPVQADLLVYHFSKFLRCNIKSMNSEAPIRFTDELEHIKMYANIERTCFEKLSVKYDIQALNFNVPPLTVQPLVENAIKHGVLKRVEGGTVAVRSFETANNYCIEVEDDGVGFDPEAISLKADSYGLRNIKMRLEHFCGATMRVDSESGSGTKVVVYIPKHKKDSGELEDSNEDDSG